MGVGVLDGGLERAELDVEFAECAEDGIAILEEDGDPHVGIGECDACGVAIGTAGELELIGRDERGEGGGGDMWQVAE